MKPPTIKIAIHETSKPKRPEMALEIAAIMPAYSTIPWAYIISEAPYVGYMSTERYTGKGYKKYIGLLVGQFSTRRLSPR